MLSMCSFNGSGPPLNGETMLVSIAISDPLVFLVATHGLIEFGSPAFPQHCFTTCNHQLALQDR